MPLRAKKPELENNRFRCLMYGTPGAGKSHFCCSFPKVYYIDTEELIKYKKYVDMLNENGSVVVRLNELDEIIEEVSSLLNEKHDYSTLVIDSISNVYTQACDSEAERLAKASRGSDPEGTEFGRNTSKPKRKIMRLGNLLSRLDMNVIVTCHAKAKYVNGKEVGNDCDVYDKLKYLLGSSMEVNVIAKKRKGRMDDKSRYSELPSWEMFDLSYEYIESRFGRDMFVSDSKPQKLITEEQLKALKVLIIVNRISDETVNKVVARAKATNIHDLPSDKAQLWIDSLSKKSNIANEDIEIDSKKEAA